MNQQPFRLRRTFRSIAFSEVDFNNLNNGIIQTLNLAVGGGGQVLWFLKRQNNGDIELCHNSTTDFNEIIIHSSISDYNLVSVAGTITIFG